MTTLQRGEEALLCRVKAVDWARLKFCFAATALCMLLAHGFAWFNLFPSHDGTILVFDADVVMLQLGRWVQLPYYRFLRGKINMPWLTGMFSVLWVSLSVYLISSLLQLRKKSMAAVAALFGTAISVTLLNATYNDKADLFTCAMLLALWEPAPCVAAAALGWVCCSAAGVSASRWDCIRATLSSLSACFCCACCGIV